LLELDKFGSEVVEEPLACDWDWDHVELELREERRAPFDRRGERGLFVRPRILFAPAFTERRQGESVHAKQRSELNANRYLDNRRVVELG
jgi:hypothetical protein